jgi:hypothetical protein
MGRWGDSPLLVRINHDGMNIKLQIAESERDWLTSKEA